MVNEQVRLGLYFGLPPTKNLTINCPNPFLRHQPWVLNAVGKYHNLQPSKVYFWQLGHW